ncbi:MAG: DEAD/DEAH box helicase, partial [Pseudoalteromonas sp.]
YLPENSYGIVTDDLSTKKRKAVLDGARDGSIKYVLQVGCLTTGVNVPRWDCVVILRNIGSLTLLTQLIGRGLRTFFESAKLAKQFFATEPHENELRQDIIAASTAPDCLVLDYSSTMDNLGEMYQNPILEEAQLSKGKFKAELIECPSCRAQNSQYARRCIGEDESSIDGRCELFWQYIECECGVKNDTAARFCRACNKQLIDPNAKLTGKHYTELDLKKVFQMTFGPTRCGNGVLIKYVLPNNEIATEVFWPFSDNKIARQLWKTKFVVKHINGFEFRSKILRCRTVGQIIGLKAVFDVPTHITHRLNDNKRSIINRKVFNSGREEIE